jgi:hypothetical protein
MASILAIPLALLALSAGANNPGEVIDLKWDDLMPKDWVPVDPFAALTEEQLYDLSDEDPLALKALDDARAAWSSAPVVGALDGKTVRLPGYMLPLEFDGTEVREFLLVPYFGACVHVPPPPSNQIVFVTSETPVASGMFDPVYVTGVLRAEASLSDLAAAGYRLEAQEVGPYVE